MFKLSYFVFQHTYTRVIYISVLYAKHAIKNPFIKCFHYITTVSLACNTKITSPRGCLELFVCILCWWRFLANNRRFRHTLLPGKIQKSKASFALKKEVKFKVFYSQIQSDKKSVSLITRACIRLLVTYSWLHNMFCLQEIDTRLDQCSMQLLYASLLYMQTMINPHRVFQCSWVCECASVRPCFIHARAV